MQNLEERIRAVMQPPYTDMCYAASEAYFHLAGGKAAGLVPVHMPEPVPSDEKHWAVRHPDGTIVDLTVEQYGGLMPDYSKARGCGFLSSRPSKRGQALIDAVLA